MIANKYIFQITFQGTTTQVEPINDDFVIDWTKEKGQQFYRKVVSTQFLFCADEFKLLFDIEKSCDRCELVQFDITRKCSTGDYIIFSGYLNMNEGNDWNEKKCSVSFTPQPNDTYTCLFENWKDEKNIITGTQKETVEQFIGVIECQTVTEPPIPPLQTFILSSIPNAAPPSVGEGWTITDNEVNGVTLVGTNPNQYEVQGNIVTEFCREFIATGTQPPGTGWIAVTGGFARPISAAFQYEQSDLNPSDGDLHQIYSVSGYDQETGQVFSYDNGATLESVLQLWTGLCGYSIKSNFFGINSDNTQPANQAYTFALSRLQNILLYQITDIKFALAFNNASIAKITLEKVLTSLRNTFNIKWTIKNNTLCIEHVTYFALNQGRDLSNEAAQKGLCKYNYISDDLPQYERFTWANSVSPYFAGSDIVYSGYCSTRDKVEEYKNDCFTTDLDYVLSNPEDIENNGFFFMAAIEYNGALYVDDSNKALSFTELHENLWRWERPQLNGNMNETSTIFESTTRTKQQEPIETRICCEDLEQFNPSDLVRSELGWGEILKASFSAKTNCLKLDLLHESNCI